jgi:hypothetical protein
MDILFGSPSFLEIIKPTTLYPNSNNAHALRSMFGWAIFRSDKQQTMEAVVNQLGASTKYELAFKQYELNSNKFWEIKDLKGPLALSA